MRDEDVSPARFTKRSQTEAATSVTHCCISASHMELPSVPLTPLYSTYCVDALFSADLEPLEWP